MRTWLRSWEPGVGSGFRNPGRGAEGALRMSSVVPVGALRSVVGGRGGTQSRCLGRGAAGLAQALSPRQLQREETRKPRRRRRPDAPNTLTGLIAPKLSARVEGLPPHPPPPPPTLASAPAKINLPSWMDAGRKEQAFRMPPKMDPTFLGHHVSAPSPFAERTQLQPGWSWPERWV